MKRKTLVLAAFLAALLSSVPAQAISGSQVAAIKKAVADVPVLEVAPKAAQLVRKASDTDKEEVAVTIVRTVLSKKPAVATSLIEAIAKVAPETAPAIAKVATELCPNQAVKIARAAAGFAPTQAAKIASNVSKAAPSSAVSVARAVIALAPIESPRIMESVIAAAPASKAAIESDKTMNMVAILARNSRSSASTAVRKGSIGTRPRVNPPPTPPAVVPPTNTVAETRSQAQIDFQKIVLPQIEATPTISKSDSSDIINTSIGTINLIARDTTITKQEKNTLMTLTKDLLVAIVTEDTLQGQSKTDLAKAAVTVVATVVADPNVNAAEQSAILQFASDQIKAIAANTTLVGTEVINTVQKVNAEVKELQQKAETTELTLQDIQASRNDVQTEISAYGTP